MRCRGRVPLHPEPDRSSVVAELPRGALTRKEARQNRASIMAFRQENVGRVCDACSAGMEPAGQADKNVPGLSRLEIGVETLDPADYAIAEAFNADRPAQRR